MVFLRLSIFFSFWRNTLTFTMKHRVLQLTFFRDILSKVLSCYGFTGTQVRPRQRQQWTVILWVQIKLGANITFILTRFCELTWLYEGGTTCWWGNWRLELKYSQRWCVESAISPHAQKRVTWKTTQTKTQITNPAISSVLLQKTWPCEVQISQVDLL